MNKYKILQLSDIHIKNEPEEHEKFRIVFDRLYKIIDEKKPNRIAIIADTLDAFITTSLEAETLAAEFLNRLTQLTEYVIVVIGNHEIRKKDLKRKSSIGSVIEMMQNKKIKLFDKSGFFEDKDIIWVNYSHLEKNILPWRDIQQKKRNDKIYIGLFHDPVYGCKLPNEFLMESKNLIKLSDFSKNDLNLLGDIHLRQYLNKTTAYCGSLIQNNFGEKIDSHGAIMWEIDEYKNIKTENIDIKNDYNYITFNILENFDYDKINFENPASNKHSEFKIIWNDYSSNINSENEEKIKKYIYEKWGSNSITFDKRRIYKKINGDNILSDKIDVNNKEIQQEIFREYLISNKYDNTFIEEILKIDDIINNRLEKNVLSENIEWSLDKLWADNFKCYDKISIDFSDVKNKIIQINGSNQHGKSTLLDLITYVTHGTTLSTNKLGGAQREKHGDNRYINNKRTLNYCEGGMVIDVNGEKFTLVRRTERELKKDKSISSVLTNLEYYEGSEPLENKKLRGERRTDTQKKLDSILGDFEDFIRLTLTNSENLNYLISLDRATFIDSVIRDAGLGIFEKKLEEFKDYKKEIATSKIELNLNDAEYEVENLKILLLTYKDEANEIQKKINKFDELLTEVNNKRDEQLKKLHPIDSEIAAIDIGLLNSRLEEYKRAININLSKQKENIEKAKTLRKEYDAELLEAKIKEIKKIDDEQLDIKLKISQNETKIEKEIGNLKNYEIEKQNVIKNEIRDIKDKIKALEQELEDSKKEYSDFMDVIAQKIRDTQKDFEFEIKNIKTELSGIKDKGILIKKQIKELEEGKVCPTCNRPYDEEHQHSIEEKIKELNAEIAKLMEKVKPKQARIIEVEPLIEECKVQLEKIKDGTFKNAASLSKQAILDKKDRAIKDEIIRLTNYIKMVEEGHVSKELTEKFQYIITKIFSSEKKIEELKNLNINLQLAIKTNDINKSKVQLDVQRLELEKEEAIQYNNLVTENYQLSLKVENIKLTIENAKHNIDKYYAQLEKIEENNKIQSVVDSLNCQRTEYENEKTTCTKKLQDIYNEAGITKNTIKDIQDRINKYKEQVRMEELLKEYNKCIAREGLPLYILTKYRELINIELSDLLSNVDFNIFFDDFLNLKMFMKDMPWAIQNLLESSGSERVFGAVSLKMALRTINTKSRPNMLLLDEVMGKFKNHMVSKFNELLKTLKNKVDKIFIIEHVHTVPYDMLITAEKDKNNVSTLTIE